MDSQVDLHHYSSSNKYRVIPFPIDKYIVLQLSNIYLANNFRFLTLQEIMILEADSIRL